MKHILIALLVALSFTASADTEQSIDRDIRILAKQLDRLYEIYDRDVTNMYRAQDKMEELLKRKAALDSAKRK